MNPVWRRLAVVAAGLAALAGVALAGAFRPQAAPGRAAEVVVHRAPACGCCEHWAEHVRAAGFQVDVREEADMDAVKARLGVPPALASCHTAVVAGYVLEGHVPARELRRLLEERPAAAGLAVPGMPVGSPGMEQGDRRDGYDVLLWRADAPPSVYARYAAAP